MLPHSTHPSFLSLRMRRRVWTRCRGGYSRLLTKHLKMVSSSFFPPVKPETWVTIIAAGIPLEKANGSKTSVFVGAMPGDYSVMMSRDTQQDRRYRASGTSHSILANRLSWFYRFTGPSMTIDTACSSSLVALDLACQSLRRGSSTMV